MRRSIAVVGSGPSGCYIAQFLRKQLPEADITVFDRLPVPYGLLRYGVAPDHQGTKAIIEQFDRLFSRGGVRFAGNVEVGVDVSLSDLREAFDVVVLATGIASDRRLGIPGETNPRVYGSGRFTRLINSHPDEDRNGLELGRRTTIVGNGNVAVDVLRTLIKSERDFRNSDIDDAFRNDIARHLTAISIFGRSPAHRAKFDKTLIRELGKVSGVQFVMHGLDDAADAAEPAAQAKVDELRLLEQFQPGVPIRIQAHFYFGWIPEGVNGKNDVRSMTFRAADGAPERLTVETDSVITAIGYTEGELDTFARTDLVSHASDPDSGVLDSGLYCTGWFGKGASGTIPEHRAESRMVASAIAEHLRTIPVAAAKGGYEELPQHVAAMSVDFDGWKAVDAVELATAAEGRYRRKIRERTELLAIARGDLARLRDEKAS